MVRWHGEEREVEIREKRQRFSDGYCACVYMRSHTLAIRVSIMSHLLMPLYSTCTFLVAKYISIIMSTSKSLYSLVTCRIFKNLDSIR